jgi:hypothetical protein
VPVISGLTAMKRPWPLAKANGFILTAPLRSKRATRFPLGTGGLTYIQQAGKLWHGRVGFLSEGGRQNKTIMAN